MKLYWGYNKNVKYFIKLLFKYQRVLCGPPLHQEYGEEDFKMYL